jgi:hypothetical protein
VAAMSDPVSAILTFTVTAMSVPLALLAAWSLFKGLI